MEDQSMKLIDKEKEKLSKAKDEKGWYAICEEIKARRNGQYPAYFIKRNTRIISREISGYAIVMDLVINHAYLPSQKVGSRQEFARINTII